MEILNSLTVFITIFLITVEIIFSLNILITISCLKKIIKTNLKNIKDFDYYRSTGRNQPITTLDYIGVDYFIWLPKFIKNKITKNLQEQVQIYIQEGGISSRERCKKMVDNLFFKESWLFDYKYAELKTYIKTIRTLYIPLAVLCSLLIFINGYSNLVIDFNSPDFESINKNIYIISFMIKTAGITLAIGVSSYVMSSIADYLLNTNKLSEQLSESIFQLKASPINIQIK